MQQDIEAMPRNRIGAAQNGAGLAGKPTSRIRSPRRSERFETRHQDFAQVAAELTT
jgi:hypothetical protein